MYTACHSPPCGNREEARVPLAEVATLLPVVDPASKFRLSTSSTKGAKR